MDRLRYSITINAPKEKVWDTMLMEDSYREWTKFFSPGSHYKGDWAEGSKILFLAPGPDGKMGGMVSRIKENREFEYVSIEHLGIVHDGKEDYESDEVKKWAGGTENYTFIEKDGQTEVKVDMDYNEEIKQMFDGIWPQALQRLKELCE